MNENKLILLQSITYATKARNLLLKFGIHSDIVKTPKTTGQSTCGYSLSVPYKFADAINILSTNGFKILGTGDSDVL
ncbi:MAG: DUF3343 domain-containing protein [Ruminococcus sp.]|nr:DUF3343 domain-containing protein [Ruminococcus sp.]MDO4419337.1 DUF3343 domain-containing protein [Ruminococcus sp.]